MNIGDTVRIVRPGAVYTTYLDWLAKIQDEMFDRNIDDDCLCNWHYKGSPTREEKDEDFKVMFISTHTIENRNLVLIANEDKTYIISEDGLLVKGCMNKYCDFLKEWAMEHMFNEETETPPSYIEWFHGDY